MVCAWPAVQNNHERSRGIPIAPIAPDAAGEEPNAVYFNEHGGRN